MTYGPVGRLFGLGNKCPDCGHELGDHIYRKDAEPACPTKPQADVPCSAGSESAVTKADLSIKMHALADKGHPRAAELREKADAFDAATKGFMGTNPPTHTVKQMVGSWARASRVFSECGGV
jgi:hypothetical protein